MIRAACERAKAWHPDRLAPLYRDFFSRIAKQPMAPLVQKINDSDAAPQSKRRQHDGERLDGERSR